MIRPNFVVACALLLGACMLSSAQVLAAEVATDDPAALALSYAREAADLRANAKRHDKLAKAHRAGAGGPKTPHARLALHCERFAEKLRAAAQESEALAATYRKLAEQQTDR